MQERKINVQRTQASHKTDVHASIRNCLTKNVIGYYGLCSPCQKRHYKSDRITYFSRLAAHFSVELDDCMYIPKILLPSKEKRPRRKIIKHYPLDAYCGQDTGILIRCCNYMGKLVFMNGRVENVLRRCLDMVFFVNGRAQRLRAQMRGLRFYEWEDSEFHCASVIPRFHEWKNWEFFCHKGDVREDYMNEPAMGVTPGCLFIH